jgi:TetR/AcrR family tetracycline transcriptional repressor
MAKIKKHEVLEAALALLHEQGLDELSTRRLAQRLSVESAALYWHFKNKAELLAAMSEEVLTRWHTLAVPENTEVWPVWVAENVRSFRAALLRYRDGARLHAGSKLRSGDRAVISAKVAYLVRCGFTATQASMALYAGGQYALGCALEEQARGAISGMEPAKQGISVISPGREGRRETKVEVFSAAAFFEFGLEMMVQGLQSRLTKMAAGKIAE